eukprot:2878883-Alexandrium_andersonii.AAC.1
MGGAPPGSAARSRKSASRRIERLAAPGLSAPAARRRLRAAGAGTRCNGRATVEGRAPTAAEALR